MKLLARYKKLNSWNKLYVWGSIASIVALIAFFVWPAPKSETHSVVQNVSHSPNSVNVAAETVVIGEPPIPGPKLREKMRAILKSINPDVINALDSGASQFSAYVSQTHLRQLEELNRQPTATNYLQLIVRGPGPFVTGNGNSGPGVWDQLQDGELVDCAFVFKDALR